MAKTKKQFPLPVDLLAEFSAGAGHFLNNPLAAIQGRIQLLLRDETNSGRQQDLVAILNQVRRAKEMIADLRLIACPPMPEFQLIEVSAFLERLGADYQNEFAQRHIGWQVACPKITISADEAMLQVLFRALLANSLRAIGTDGTISIEVTTDSKLVLFRVADTGHGIAPEVEPLIFDPYYSSYPAGRGLGFGLPKARLIARLHGGDVTLESPVPAVFHVQLSSRS